MRRSRNRWILLIGVAAALTAATGLGSSTGLPGAVPAAAGAQAGSPTYGPVLDDFGPVYFMGEVDFATPLDRDFKAVFDVSQATQQPDAPSAAIETAARFLNMHGQAGVPRERLGAAIVLHGGAGRYALSHAAYRQRYEVDNPALALLEALRAAGARIVICGQTAAARGYAREELAAPVEVALSAMTAIKVLQDDGYQIVSF